MAVTNTAVFPQAARLPSCICTAAKTTLNDTTNAVLLDTAGTNGTMYKHIGAVPRATITATQALVLVQPASNTTMVAALSAATIPAFTVTQIAGITPTALLHIDATAISESNPLVLASGDKLWAGIGVALGGGVVFNAQAEDL